MSEIMTDDEMVKMIREQADELENCAAAMRAAGAEIDRLRLALETATREAEEERRTAEAAVKFLGRIAEVTWEAGLPGGDREQTLKNVRTLAFRPAPPADAPPLPPGCTHDPSLVCLRCRVVIPMPAPQADAVREAAEIVCERLDGPGGAYYREIAPGLMYDIEALRAALSSPAPAPSAPAMRRCEVKG